jgi:hypothetical protein
MRNKDSKTYEELQRGFFRQNVHRIWSMVKADRFEGLSGAERKLAGIIMHHQEYADHFENIDILDGREYDAGATFNPFFHISIHQMVEDQLLSNTPIETVLFCEAMENKGLPRHEAIHSIMMILIHVIYASASTGKPFDSVRYKQLLNEYRDIDPSDIDLGEI